MSEALEQKKRRLQSLLLQIPMSGSFESVSLTRQVSELTAEIDRMEKLEQEARSNELRPERHAAVNG